MSFSPSDSYLFAPLFGDSELAEIFADEQFVHRMLDVEAALARVESRLGLIPAAAGVTISSAAAGMAADMEQLRAGVLQDGFPVIELVRQLRDQVGMEFGDAIHYGATTQDVMDTALILQIRAALALLERSLSGVITGLAGLADRHHGTLMAGRTHSQQALPVTFGFKVAGWLAPLLRDRRRLIEMKPRLLAVQFGGAVGTLASLGERGLEVQAALAKELDLAVLPIPWHTQRDTLAELAGWLSLVSGSLGKMAQDIILLAQSEVGEVRESDDPQRGSSSAMPQKSNPITSEWILAAARDNAGRVAAIHQALINEYERGTHGWQLEWLNLPQMFANTGSALQHTLWLTQHLQVDADRMRANVLASNGLMMAEALSVALAQHIGRARARKLVSEAARAAQKQNRHLVDVVREQTEAPVDWETLRDEASYLGAAKAFIEKVLMEV